ncbi:MAG TPA: hypothetical protein PK119_01775 [Candidatus Paceibacterota bacterium]|nr:hypothetical protein [Candidatus Paceibacterota bacterium]
MGWEQFTTQISEFIIDLLKGLDQIVNQVFMQGIIGHFLAILKGIGQILIAALEAIVKLLKFLVK